MRRTPWVAAGIGCFLAAVWILPNQKPEPARMFGPLAPIAAQIQWVRAHAARLAGEEGRAFLLMESAVQLEPHSSTAWISLSNQLALQLASAESGRSPGERSDWLHAACSALIEGQAYARQPQRLALHRGLLLMSHAESDPDITWENGTAGLWSDAADAFDEARALASDADSINTAATARDYARSMAKATAALPNPP